MIQTAPVNWKQDPRFAEVIERVLGHEAGYVNDPNDPGGETKWGISKRSYPNLNIADLTREDAIALYYRDFWQPIAPLSSGMAIAYQLLDFAVNSGMGNARRALQRAVGVAPDGIIGPITLAAVERASECDVVMLLLAERLEFMTALSNWPHHGRGWARRVAKNLRYAAADTED